MTPTIDVACAGTGEAWTCDVAVDDGRGAPSRHVVEVAGPDLARLDPGAADPEDLVRRSFEFLLAREPKESILRRFELTVIGRYFPEYERTIRG
jgi:hypothetical protein